MSEYQYYEFAAVDRPLDRQELADVRALSTRAHITPTSFVNEYHWGNFRGNPQRLVEQYYDAFLYLANWGTRQLMLRFPVALLAPSAAERYCVGESASSWSSSGYVIVSATSEDDESDFEWGGEGVLSSVLPVRAEILSGDLRALYLMWLLEVGSGVVDGREKEPPVPEGLATLTGSQTALAEFLRIDPDLLAVAASASATRRQAPGPDIEGWVANLAAAERDALLIGLLRGDEPHLRATTLRRMGTPATEERTERTADQLVDAACARRDARERAEKTTGAGSRGERAPRREVSTPTVGRARCRGRAGVEPSRDADRGEEAGRLRHRGRVAGRPSGGDRRRGVRPADRRAEGGTPPQARVS